MSDSTDGPGAPGDARSAAGSPHGQTTAAAPRRRLAFTDLVLAGLEALARLTATPRVASG